MVHFYKLVNKSDPIESVTKDTVDDYILWMRENTEANDITINSYLRSMRTFLYGKPIYFLIQNSAYKGREET